MDEINKLKTVHDAMNSAVLETNTVSENVPFAIRMTRQERERTQEICERHGTTISEFIRQCCRALIADYSPTLDQ